MRFSLRLGPLRAGLSGYTPPAFASLLSTAEAGGDIAPFVMDFANGLGFDSFLYWMAIAPREGDETQAFIITTDSADWTKTYNERAYIEVDPRVQVFIEATLPCVWNQCAVLDQSPRVAEFLATAHRYGIAGRVVAPLRDSYGNAGMVALGDITENWNTRRDSETRKRLGDVALFARYFHEIFRAAVAQRQLIPSMRSLQLSVRERECLFLATNGLGYEDIAGKLQISINTLRFHFDSIRSKLDAPTAQQAMLKASKLGML